MDLKGTVETLETVHDISTAPQELVDRYNDLINEGYNPQTAFNRANFEFTIEKDVSMSTGGLYHDIAWVIGGIPGVIAGGIEGGIATFPFEWGVYPGAAAGGVIGYSIIYFGLTIPTNLTATAVAEVLGQIFYPLPNTPSPNSISTTFTLNNEGSVDVNTSITTAMGMTGTSSVETMLNNMQSLLQQSVLTLGNITVNTDFTDPADVAYIADNLKSYATLKTEVVSPIGDYILGSNGSDSLTGGNLKIKILSFIC